jgi:hypothetical protein
MTARSLIALLAVAMMVLAVASTPASPAAVGAPATAGATTAGATTAGATTDDAPSTAGATTAATTAGATTDDAPSTAGATTETTGNTGVVLPPGAVSNPDLVNGLNVRVIIEFLGTLEQWKVGPPRGLLLVEFIRIFLTLNGVASITPRSATDVANTGRKFVKQNVEVVFDIVATDAAAASTILQTLTTAINSGVFADAGITVLEVTQVAAPGSAAATTTTGVTTPIAPAVAPSGGVTSGNIDITILGTRSAFTTTDQNALTSAVAAAISGTAAIVNIVETNTNARKFTMQASALRVTVAVTAPSAQYPTLASIVARLQTVARQNQGRLGNSSVVSITISDSDSAASRGPVAMTFLVAAIVAVLSAMF